MLEIPEYIKKGGVVGGPIKHKWSEDIALHHYGAKDQNVKLYRSIDEANFKAKMALGVAVSEWIIWRFDGLADLKDAHQRVEAAWADAVHPTYAKDLRFKLVREPVFGQDPAVDGPLKLALNFLGDIDAHYATGNIYLAAPIVKQAMLAKDVVGNRKLFEDWLKTVVERAAKTFPSTKEYNDLYQKILYHPEVTEKYDPSGETPIPREFFDPDFEYDEESAQVLLGKFLASLDYKKNLYLNSPEEMNAKGFQGTPYSL